MKQLILVAILSLVGVTSFANDVSAVPFTITKVERNHMFPVETVTLTYLKTCGGEIIGKIQEKIGNQVVLGILGNALVPEIVCLAMPVEVRVTFSVPAETPVDLLVLGYLKNQMDVGF